VSGFAAAAAVACEPNGNVIVSLASGTDTEKPFELAANPTLSTCTSTDAEWFPQSQANRRLDAVSAAVAGAADLLPGPQSRLCRPDRAGLDVKHSGAGYVTEFDVDTDYLDRFDVHQVGGRTILEYWIPAEGLDEFSSNIVGEIRVVDRFSADDT
jgi:hypothetical protein